jgi:hypothetical protein
MPAAELLLGMLGRRLAPIKPLLDQTIYDFEQTRVNQAAEADMDQEAEHYLGILGETLAEVKDVMRQEYDYSLWWRQIVIQETPEDHDLTHRLQAALATLPPPTQPGRPLRQPALFAIQPVVTTPDKADEPAAWNPLLARRRLANTAAAKAAPAIPLTPERGDHEREG